MGLQLYSCRVPASVIVGVLLAMGIPSFFFLWVLMIFWKHSEGVFRTPWRVYWYLFYLLLFGSSIVCQYRCSFLLLFSEPSALFIL